MLSAGLFNMYVVKRILEDFDSLIDVLARYFVGDLDDTLCDIVVVLLSARCGSLRFNCLWNFTLEP